MNSTEKQPAARGRPKTFDRESALNGALELFWRFGYEPTSMAELTRATGTKAATLYAEFGSKEGLFCAAVERYLSTYGQKRDEILGQDALPVPEIIEQLLRISVRWFTDPATPSGCFMVSAAFGMSSEDDALFNMLQTKRNESEQRLIAFLACRISREELPAATDAPLLAKYVTNMMQGMSVQARNGTAQEMLSRMVDVFMRLWPALCAQCE